MPERPEQRGRPRRNREPRLEAISIRLDYYQRAAVLFIAEEIDMVPESEEYRVAIINFLGYRAKTNPRIAAKLQELADESILKQTKRLRETLGYHDDSSAEDQT